LLINKIFEANASLNFN